MRKLLSYSALITRCYVKLLYKGSAKSPETEKVVEATRIAKEMAPELTLDGEFQFDAAFVPSVAEKKLQVLQLKVMLTYSYSQA